MASSSRASNHPRNGKGRKKVRIEKMENKSKLQVTFSKRRYGLFKKASELCTLTGSEIGIVVFSPGRKVFSFGHPSVHNIMDDYFPTDGDGSTVKNDSVMMPSLRHMRCDKTPVEDHKETSVAEQNLRMSVVEMQMKAEKRHTIVVEERENEEMVGHAPIEGMMEKELIELAARLNVLKESLLRSQRCGGVPDPDLN